MSLALNRALRDFDKTKLAARARNIIQVLGDEERGFSAFRDCARWTRDQSLDGSVAAIVAGINRATVDDLEHFAVHAGVVQSGDRVVAMPGESGHGKTTLTAALLQCGLEYLSDEALILTENGVMPYPKPLALSEWSQTALGLDPSPAERLVRPDELGSRVGPGGALTDLVITRRGNRSAKLESRPRSEAVTALIGMSFNHFKDPARSFQLATSIARRVHVWELAYDDPLSGATILKEGLEI